MALYLKMFYNMLFHSKVLCYIVLYSKCSTLQCFTLSVLPNSFCPRVFYSKVPYSILLYTPYSSSIELNFKVLYSVELYTSKSWSRVLYMPQSCSIVFPGQLNQGENESFEHKLVSYSKTKFYSFCPKSKNFSQFFFGRGREQNIYQRVNYLNSRFDDYSCKSHLCI